MSSYDDQFPSWHGNRLGTASWLNQMLTLALPLSPTRADSDAGRRIQSTLVHELLHYFQFVATHDGMSWFFQALKWTDLTYEALRSTRGPIQVPLASSEHSACRKAVEAYAGFDVTAALFMDNEKSDFVAVSIDEPLLELVPGRFLPFSGRHLYEGFAHINQCLETVQISV